jgi:hypothetical protein
MWPLTRHGLAGELHAFELRIDAERSVPPGALPVHDGHDRIDCPAAALAIFGPQGGRVHLHR